ncbi:MAG: hypothetical protein DMG64_00395, partial [Acidobacteria bacterium]
FIKPLLWIRQIQLVTGIKQWPENNSSEMLDQQRKLQLKCGGGLDNSKVIFARSRVVPRPRSAKSEPTKSEAHALRIALNSAAAR